VGKAKKVKRLGLTFALPFTILNRKATKTNQSGLRRIQLQPKLSKPYFKRRQKRWASDS